jgi:hypothetical protein
MFCLPVYLIIWNKYFIVSGDAVITAFHGKAYDLHIIGVQGSPIMEGWIVWKC